MIAIIDYGVGNLFSLRSSFAAIGQDAVVTRNIEEIRRADRLILPGVGAFQDAAEKLRASGMDKAVKEETAKGKPLLGVCLGHQAIGAAFGGDIIRAGQQMHGKTSVITTDQKGVFAGLPQHFTVNRYHSLVIDRATLPDCLAVTATSEDGEIQGVRHKLLPVEGVQFHPESILTEHGHAMLKNFLQQP